LSWRPVSSPHVSEQGLPRLTGLTSLTELGLGFNQVMEGGLAHLAKLTSLRRLYLYDAPLSDAAVDPFVKLPSLASVDLGHETEISNTAPERLRRVVRYVTPPM
jgi:Leucine-rich repeat (LRR) protein